MLPIFLIHWNAPDWCASACRSILASDIPVTVTVIDNGPPEASAQLRLAVPDSVTMVAPLHNGGFSAGANVAVDLWLHGAERYAIIGAHDLHVDSGTLSAVVAAADAAPDFGIIAPRISTEPKTGSGLVDKDWVSGGCMLLRRECALHAGGFDERIGSYVEDVDLCWRVQALGWRVGEHQEVTYDGLGSVSPMRVKTIKLNSIKVVARHKGMSPAVCLAVALVANTARTSVTSMAPGRTKAQRATSRMFLRNNYAALKVAVRPSFWREVRHFHKTPPRPVGA